MSVFQLYRDFATDEKFNVSILPATPKIRHELRSIENRFNNRTRTKVRKAVEDLRAFMQGEDVSKNANIETQLSEIAIKHGFSKIEELSEAAEAAKADAERWQDIRMLEIAREVIDTRSMSKEDAALIKSDVEGDFWQSQDIEVIRKICAFFR